MNQRKRIHNWDRPVKSPIAVETQNGVTQRSLATVKTHQPKLHSLLFVELIAPFGKAWADYLIRLIDEKGNYIELDGVAWGYAGEGAHGLVEVFKMFNVPIGIHHVSGWHKDHYIIDVQNPVILDCHCIAHRN